MIGGDAQPELKPNDFSQYSDAELFAELARLANELGIKTTLTPEPEPKRDVTVAEPKMGKAVEIQRGGFNARSKCNSCDEPSREYLTEKEIERLMDAARQN